MSAIVPVPPVLRDAWMQGDWRPVRAETAARRTPALPALRALLDRFLRGEAGLVQFTKESQDFAVAQPHWGFKGFAQMQLNQYAKVAQAANLVDEAERVLRAALPAPSDDDQARRALRDLVALTQQFVDEAGRLGVGKPAPGRVPLVVSYFWEAQDRDHWPIAYPASKGTLEEHGLYRESGDPVESYLALRNVILHLGRELGGDVFDIETLLWVLRPKKAPAPAPPAPPQPAPLPGTPTVALPDVYAAYRDQELIFPDELVTTFLLSLWTKPFVILTGISGTGKTGIAQALAHALEPGTADASASPALEPGDERHASFRLTDWALRSGRLYVGADQLPAFDIPERGGSVRIALTLPGGTTGMLRLNNIDLSATTREVRLLFADTSTRRWLVDHAKAGDVLRLEFDAADRARASILPRQGAGEARRRLLIPVRADWNDSRGLLGFWNPITAAYERTALVDLLLRAAKDLEQPYFLILDEMNLARVEYYFSDFLSAMESGEPIPLYSDDGLDETVPATLPLPPNVFVIGTVNIDETTHAFSPKVLDRASVIEFNDVLVLSALAGAREEQQPQGPFRLANPGLRLRDFRPLDDATRRALRAELVESGPTYSDRLVNLHGLLERYHLHFGYRVIDEITTFVALAWQRVGPDDATLATAFDLAVCQKILPKLNGGRELDEPLRRLLAFLIDPDDFGGDRWRDAEERWNKADEARRGQGEGPDVAYPRGARKTARMLRRLAETGFASFLE